MATLDTTYVRISPVRQWYRKIPNPRRHKTRSTNRAIIDDTNQENPTQPESCQYISFSTYCSAMSCQSACISRHRCSEPETASPNRRIQSPRPAAAFLAQEWNMQPHAEKIRQNTLPSTLRQLVINIRAGFLHTFPRMRSSAARPEQTAVRCTHTKYYSSACRFLPSRVTYEVKKVDLALWAPRRLNT